MNKVRYFPITIAFIIFFSCTKKGNKNEFTFNNGENKIRISLEQYTDTNYAIRAITGQSFVSDWKLNYPVYRFDCADVDGDESPDIAVGVIKTTRFDPEKGKRLFLFKLSDGYVRPLWLGSRMPHPLVDFCLVKDKTPALIRTIEKEQDGSFLVAEYRWRGFGPEFIQYVQREITEIEARKLLNLI